MPSYKKMLRIAAQKAKLAEEAALAAVLTPKMVEGGDAEDARDDVVAVDSVAAEAPVFEIEQKKADSGLVEVVSGVSIPTVIPGDLSDSIKKEGAHLPLPEKAPETQGNEASGAVLVRVYGKPLNPRIRFIEFEDGSHGRLWVNVKAAPMIGWTVWVKPYVDIPEDWVMHGKYNSMGVRRA